ncbi:MAG TPA: MlaE family lipid ABC transporter permease subunit [Kofleriaceae bacterium]|nr:MlaE family lipid ABC transporter permease subunit [Kofleriaceae bacterium]
MTVPRDPDNEPTEVREVGGVRGADGPGVAGGAANGVPAVAVGSMPVTGSPAGGTPAATGMGGDGPAEDRGGGATQGPVRALGGAVIQGVKDVGTPVVRFLDNFGGHLILVGRALVWLPRRPYRLANYLEAGEYIGFASLPIVLLVGAFTGMVTSLQSVEAFRQFGLESFSGGTTGKALSTELGPVLTSLMIAGRAGAGIATELGTMRISEQIDALESMAVNPVQYLVLPRLIASMIVMPILALLFFVVGMGGAWLVAVVLSDVDQGQWVANVRDIVVPMDVIQGLIKSVFFGFMVALVGCYQGYNASGGGRGVGMGTTRAVVIASVSTLVMDFFLSAVLIELLRTGK